VKLMTWQENNVGCPSIVSLIEGMLQDESMGKTEPINDYTRHTLKALAMFIRGDFLGYEYESTNAQNVEYPYVRSSNIINRARGIVGTASGLVGFLRQSTDDLTHREYQYSESDCPHNRNWVSLDDFKQIYNWKMNGTPPVIKWDGERKVDASILHKIVTDCCPPQKLFVGIGGGLNALRAMEKEVIERKAWRFLTADGPPNQNWISGSDFREVMDEKGF